MLKNLWDKISTYAKSTGQTILLLVAAALLIVTFMHGCEANSRADQYATEMKDWKGKAETALSQSAEIKKQNDSVLAVVHIDSVKADSITTVNKKLTVTTTKLRARNDSLLALAVTTVADSGCTCAATAIEAAQGFKEEADSLKKVIVNDDKKDSTRVRDIVALKFSNGKLVAANDSLTKVILKVPVYKPEKLLGFIPLPSRKQSFVTGVVAGIVVTGVVISSIHK